MRDQAQLCEALLARLFTDAGFRQRFVRNPRQECAAFGLADAAIEAFTRADFAGLELAARSYANKRSGRQPREPE